MEHAIDQFVAVHREMRRDFGEDGRERSDFQGIVSRTWLPLVRVAAYPIRPSARIRSATERSRGSFMPR